MRAKLVRSMQGALAFGAFFILTGAKGEGCGPIDGDGDDGSSTSSGAGGSEVVCPDGSHLESKCDEYGIFCWDECVSDETCPDGTVLDYVCEPIPADPSMCPDPMIDCGGGGGQCYPTCVPIDPCGPDFHEEWVCEGVMEPQEHCDQPPPECYPVCVPNNNCGPGMHEEWVCEDPGVDPMNPDQPVDPLCYPVCVPDPLCPPGTHEEVQCGQPEPADPQDPMIPPEECWVSCIPDTLCEPGTHEEVICESDPMDPMNSFCYSVCVPDQPECPPDTQPVQICAEDGMGGFYCWIECYGQAEPPPME